MKRSFLQFAVLALAVFSANGIFAAEAEKGNKSKKAEPVAIEEPFFEFLSPESFYDRKADGSLTLIKTPGGPATHCMVRTIARYKYGTLELELDPSDFNMVSPMTFQLDGRGQSDIYTGQLLIQIPDAYNKGISIFPQQFNDFPGAVNKPKLHPGMTLSVLKKTTKIKIVIAKGREAKGTLDILVYQNGNLVAEDCGRIADPWQADPEMSGFVYTIALCGNTTKLADTGRVTLKSFKFTPSKR